MWYIHMEMHQQHHTDLLRQAEIERQARQPGATRPRRAWQFRFHFNLMKFPRRSVSPLPEAVACQCCTA